MEHFAFIYLEINTHKTTIKENKAMTLKELRGGEVQGRVWRQQREKGNDVILL